MNQKKSEITNCKIKIEHNIPAYGFAIFKVKFKMEYTNPENFELKEKSTFDGGSTIESDKMKVEIIKTS